MTPTHASRVSWAPVAVGYLLYVTLFSVGYFLEVPVLNVAGALGMVFVSSVGNYSRMFTVRPRPPATWALLLIASFFLSFLSNPGAERFFGTLKFALVLLVFVQVFSWQLPPVSQSRWGRVLLGACIAIIALSVIWGRHFVTDEERRLSGVFANPNNLALMAMALVFFARNDDRALAQAVPHALLIGTLVLTGTAGAILAYMVGLAYRFRARVSRAQALASVLVLIVVAAAGARFLESGERIVRQAQVISENVGAAVRADDLEYGELAVQYGGSATSGVWRISMWSRVVRQYLGGGPVVWAIGNGVGASREIFGVLPHNDYLRMLTDAGALGLFAFLGFLISTWRRMRPESRYVLLMFVIYSFSENNLDNFLFMTLLMVFLGGELQGTPARKPAEMARARIDARAYVPESPC